MPDRLWRSLDEWQAASEPDGAEFHETPIGIEAGPDRRGFLKAVGFSFGSAALAGCSRTVPKIEPNLIQPEGSYPGDRFTTPRHASPAPRPAARW